MLDDEDGFKKEKKPKEGRGSCLNTQCHCSHYSTFDSFISAQLSAGKVLELTIALADAGYQGRLVTTHIALRPKWASRPPHSLTVSSTTSRITTNPRESLSSSSPWCIVLLPCRRFFEMIEEIEPKPGRYVSARLLRHAPLAFAIYHDVRLYVAEKLDDRWDHVSLYQNDTALFPAALNPYHPSREKKAGPRYNYRMLCLLVSKEVGISCEKELESCRSACSEVYSSWADMTHHLSAMQIEELGDLTESRASFAQSPRILQWVMCTPKPLNTLWLLGAPFKMHFEGILTDVIETVLQHGVHPNRNCGKSTLWIFFPFWLSRRTHPTHSPPGVLKLTTEFLRRGASLSQDMSAALDEQLPRDETDTKVPCERSLLQHRGHSAHDVAHEGLVGRRK